MQKLEQTSLFHKAYADFLKNTGLKPKGHLLSFNKVFKYYFYTIYSLCNSLVEKRWYFPKNLAWLTPTNKVKHSILIYKF